MIPDKTLVLSVPELTILSEALKGHKEKALAMHERVKELDKGKFFEYNDYDRKQIFAIEALQERITDKLYFSDHMLDEYIKTTQEEK